MTSNVTHLRPPKPCPICSKPSVQAYHPFCSQRCADLDLGRWLNGSYVIPGGGNESPQEEDGIPDIPTYEDDD